MDIISDNNNNIDNIENTNINNTTNDNENNNTKKEEQLFNQKDKLKMRDLIDNLSKDGKIEVLKIIVKNEEKFNENNNGVLFDLSKMKSSTLTELNKFLTFTINNKKELNKTEKLIDNYKDYFN